MNKNRDERFRGNSPLAVSICNKSITDAINAAGRPPPTYRDEQGVEQPRCLSWHVKGMCNRNCDRRADHITLPAGPANELYEWCVPAFA